MITEEWRNISGYGGLYQVSNNGRIRSLDRKVKNRKKVAIYYTSGKLEIYSSVTAASKGCGIAQTTIRKRAKMKNEAKGPNRRKDILKIEYVKDFSGFVNILKSRVIVS
jgi:hypothetical protein